MKTKLSDWIIATLMAAVIAVPSYYLYFRSRCFDGGGDLIGWTCYNDRFPDLYYYPGVSVQLTFFAVAIAVLALTLFVLAKWRRV